MNVEQPLQPLVSVILPVYNGARFVREAVESIERQQYRPLEIIIVDDGSTDATPQILQNLDSDHIRFIWQANAGPAAARNAGLALASGELIGFLDADDLWPVDKLETQVARLTQDPALDVVMGRIQYISLPDAPERDLKFDSDDQTIVHVHLGGALFRHSVFKRIGVFDESLNFSEDVDLFMRIREQGLNIVILATITLYYRLHEHNMTHDQTINNQYLVKALKKSLDRRRRQGNLADLTPLDAFDEARQTP